MTMNTGINGSTSGTAVQPQTMSVLTEYNVHGHMSMTNVSPDSSQNYPLPIDESYPPTMTMNNLLHTVAGLVSSAYPAVEPSRVRSVVTGAVKTIDAENRRNSTRSSQPPYSSSAAAGGQHTSNSMWL